MNHLDLMNEMIPGYISLPEALRNTFEHSEKGQQVTGILNEAANAIQQGENNLLAWLGLGTNKSRQEYIQYYRIQIEFVVGHAFLNQVKENNAKTEQYKDLCLNLLTKYADFYAQAYSNQLNFQLFFDQQKTCLNIQLLNDAWFINFETALANYIKKNMDVSKTQSLFMNNSTFMFDMCQESFAYLSQQKEAKSFFDLIYKIADAHAFLQAIGFATQNESSWLAAFDLINYFRMMNYVAETKTFFFKLIQPFMPILIEYFAINKEQNLFWQIIRTLTPLLIVSAVIILTAALLSSFVIPEVAFLFLLIPTLYVGLLATSCYVVAKNAIYNHLHIQQFGGQFNIPEYQVNDGMIKSFDNIDNATKVRNYYVEEIKACFEKEKEYAGLTKLSDMDKNHRQINATRSRDLTLEWYDIHSNPALTTNQTLNIALNRIQLDGKSVCKKIPVLANNTSEKEINDFSHEVSHSIKTALESQDIAHTPRFFAPIAYLKHKEQVHFLKTFKDELEQTKQQMSPVS